MMLYRVVFLIFILFPTIGAAQDKGLVVVTSIPPLNALAAGLTDGITTPTLLIPPEASHHHYALKPSNMQALSHADVLVWIGPSLEIFLEKPLSQVSSKTTVIEVQTLPQLTLYPVRNHQQWDHDHHTHGSVDPHLWLDPHNAIIITKVLAKVFSEKDPAHAAQYQKNATGMIKKIEELDERLKKELAPIKEKRFLVFHDGYQYFEKYYGLQAAGSIAINTDLPPSAQHVHALQEQIKKENISCVFAEPGVSPALINTLVRDTAVRVGTLDNVGKGHNFNDYLHLMQSDGDSLAACLNAPPVAR